MGLASSLDNSAANITEAANESNKNHDIQLAADMVLQTAHNKQQSQQAYEVYHAELRHIEEVKTWYHAAAIITAALLCNHQIGFYIGPNWNNDINDYVMKFWDQLYNHIYPIMLKVPQLVPLLWPTGTDKNEVALQSYPNNAYEYSQKVDPDGDLMKPYLTVTLPKYFRNIFIANTFREDVVELFKQAQFKQIIDICGTYIDRCAEIEIDEDFNLITQNLIAKLPDPTDWRFLYSRARKGVTEKEVMYVPAHYPFQPPIWTLYEACVIGTNQVLNMYGVPCLLSNNEYITKETQNQPHTNGGMCFKYNTKPIEEWHKTISSKVWDGTTLVKPAPYDDPNRKCDELHYDDIIDVATQTISFPEWMTSDDNTDVDKSMRVIGSSNVIFNNPTRFIAQQYIVGETNEVYGFYGAFKLEPMSAVISKRFQKEWLQTFYGMMATTYRIAQNNLPIWTVGDYLLDPSFFDIAWNKIIVDNAYWKMIFPVVDCTSMAKINTVLLQYNGVKPENLPQYIWTHNVGLENNELKDSKDQPQNQPLSVPDWSNQFNT